MLLLLAIAFLPIVRGYLRDPMLEAAEECRRLGYDGVHTTREPFECTISYLNTKGTTSTITVEMSDGLAVQLSHAVKVLRAYRDAGVKIPEIESPDLMGLEDKWQKEL